LKLGNETHQVLFLFKELQGHENSKMTEKFSSHMATKMFKPLNELIALNKENGNKVFGKRLN
jgi:hypothetical protein